MVNWLVPLISLYALDIDIACSTWEGACNASPAMLQMLAVGELCAVLHLHTCM